MKPTDEEIVEVLVLHYRVHESKVLQWLLDMDFESLETTMILSEFS